MPVELKGQQIRVGVTDKRRYDKFRTEDTGRKGFFQIVMGREKRSGLWEIQSYRINLSDYETFERVRNRLDILHEEGRITTFQWDRALSLARNWWMKNRHHSRLS